MQYQFYVYILKCADESLYTGFTNNIERRLKEHNYGNNKGSYTFKRRPVQLIYHEVFNDVFQAKYFERKIKKWSRAKKTALANGDFVRLQLLSICQNDSSSAFVSINYEPKKYQNRDT